MSYSTEQRRRNGRKGALVTLTGSEDWTKLTAPARAAGPASLEYHAKIFDPEGKLPAEIRQRRAEKARELFYRNLNDKSVAARRARAAAKAEPPAAA